jgi:RNA polymerase sigma-70 factor (ECF subfamily)
VEETRVEDSQTWKDWIAEHGPRLVLFARRWSLDHSDAEDLVQEAFVRFWRTRDGVRDPLAYLYQTVRSVAIDAARSRQAREGREATCGASQRESPQFACALEHAERRQQIEAALAELPLEQAEVVTLKIWSALTFAQIAEVTSTPSGTVASRYRYALDNLRSVLSESEMT